MRLRTGDQMIERKAAELRANDPVGYAAWMLRHRNLCPVCSGRVRKPTENAVTSNRIFHCLDCHWTAQVSESQYQGTAYKALRGICEAALAMRKAREDSRRTVSRTRKPRRSKDRTRSRSRAGDENRDQSTDVQSGSLPPARTGD